MIQLPLIETSVSQQEAHRLRELAEGALVLEVGSWRGFSTVTMAQVAQRVHAVDWHRGDEHAGHDESLPQLMANIEAYDVKDRVIVHIGDAADVLPLLPHRYFDLAFIDAFHETEAVRRDIEMVLPLVRVYGHIAFHDYGRFGVREAVDDLWITHAVKQIDLTETLMVVRKL